MGLRIATNTDANSSYGRLSATQGMISKSMEKLSSGLRINRAADDAAGLTIAEGLKNQAGSLKMGAKNAQDGVSLIQTADGVLAEVEGIYQRMNELSVQYNNSVNADGATSDAALTNEFDTLGQEIDRIMGSAKFNGQKIFSTTDPNGGAAVQIGGGTGLAAFQVGDDSVDVIQVDLTNGGTDVSVTGLGTLDIADSNTVRDAIASVSAFRSNLGASQNRLEAASNVANVTAENLTATESRIRDVDMAQEMVKFSKNNILSQAGTSMLAQANQASQGVLSLLR